MAAENIRDCGSKWHCFGLPWWRSNRESTCKAWSAGAAGSVPVWGRSPGRENGNPLQYSCLEKPTDTGILKATVHTVTQSQTWLQRLSTAQHCSSREQTEELDTLNTFWREQSHHAFSWWRTWLKWQISSDQKPEGKHHRKPLNYWLQRSVTAPFPKISNMFLKV